MLFQMVSFCFEVLAVIYCSIREQLLRSSIRIFKTLAGQTYHLLSLEVSNAKCHARDCVTANEFYQLARGRESGIRFNCRQLQILQKD